MALTDYRLTPADEAAITAAVAAAVEMYRTYTGSGNTSMGTVKLAARAIGCWPSDLRGAEMAFIQSAIAAEGARRATYSELRKLGVWSPYASAATSEPQEVAS